MHTNVKYAFVSWVWLSACFALTSGDTTPTSSCRITNPPTRKSNEHSMEAPVYKHTLDNGLTLLIHPVKTVPKVSIQLFYDVGSKHEKDQEKGIAHLIEHMIFKGTQGKKSLNLSESDINVITHMLSGNCNAFTSHDYTGYLFNFPSHHWKEALPIMADCMEHCAFKEDHLSSEMKAVIQELKMRKDNYTLTAAEALLTAIFADHPYHYPIIGYKQDLWNAHSSDLMVFYRKHYCPNNATLVIVGDVDVEEVIQEVEEYFGSIPANPALVEEIFYTTKDLVSKAVTLYRDVQQPSVLLAFVIPGATSKLSHVTDILSWALGMGKGSRLYKKIVDEKKLATSLSASSWELFDHSILFIDFEPKKLDDIDSIISVINQEITAIATNGLSTQELTRALKKTRMQHYNLLENTQSQAYEIGKYFLATGDENYVFTALDESPEVIHQKIKEILAQYCRPSIMHRATVLPLPAQERSPWAQLQAASDKVDNGILSARIRTTPVEQPSYAHTIEIQTAPTFDFPKPTITTLSNGIKLLSYMNDATAKIDLVLELKAKGYYDDEQLPGLYNFMTHMLTEGTEHYSAVELAQELESRGMSLNVSPGTISMSMLHTDLEKGLELLMEILTKATFPESEIEKVRTQLLADIKNFWDSPSNFAGQLIRECVYAGHPYSKNGLGTKESIEAITKKDLIKAYQRFISPDGATLALVGDTKGYSLENVLNKIVGAWEGEKVPTLEFPKLAPTSHREVIYPINRDQVVLCFAGLSVGRTCAEFDKLSLFDQVLGGGVLGSMSSRLFDLREQSGLFYSINGSLTAGANEQPGMVLVKTLVSLDRLEEAQKAITETLRTAVDTLSEQELEEAKNAIANSLVLNFESNGGIANAFLFIERYKFPRNYFDQRASQLQRLTVPDIQEAVQRILNVDALAIFKIGRLTNTTTA